MKSAWKKRRIVIAVIIIAAIIFGLALYMIYFTRSRAIIASANPDKSLYPITGIDISAHNGEIDFDAVAADSVDFVYVKATEGGDFKDRNFYDNIRKARKAGLKVGAYHFFRFDAPGHMQALNFLNSIGNRQLDLPLAIDVEEWGNPGGIDDDTILGRLGEMTDYLESRGYRVIVYTNKKGFTRFIDQRRPRMLWICSFTNPPGPDKWQLWQHTHRGNIDGIKGSVDVNTFNGSRDKWESWLNILSSQH